MDLVDAGLCGHEFSSLPRVVAIADELSRKSPPGEIRVVREDRSSAVIDGGDNIAYSYSYSCTSDGPDLAASELSATIKACTSEVRRQDAGKLKLEEWRLPGNVVIIDVSISGKNVPGAMEGFRKRIAEPLLAAGIVPSADSKSELGSRCQ